LTAVRGCTPAERDAVSVFAQQLDGIRQRFAQVDQQQTDPGLDAAVLPQAVAAISLDEWDVLLTAVKTRLRLTVGDAQMQYLNGAATPLQAKVLECVDALDQLHAMLHHALMQRPGGGR
jgi:hypothetical protein